MSERALETIEKLAKVLGVVVVVGTIAIAVALVVVNVSDDESPAPPPAEEPEQDQTPSGPPIASTPGEPQDRRTTNRVWERYKERLIDHYDAVGGGIGADGIIIFLEHYADEPTAPQSVRGVAIRFMVTGQFRAQ